MSFASGFYGTMAQGMSDKRAFIRDRVTEDRQYLRTQGLKRMEEVSKQRQAYETAAQSLIRRGANEETILGTLEADPQGLLEAYREITERGVTNPAAINSVFEINNEYSGASLTEILSKVIPAVSGVADDADPAEVGRRSLAGFLGLDIEDALNEQVYRSEIVGGMTGDDILAATGSRVAAQGTGNVSLNLGALETAKPLSGTEITAYHSQIDADYTEQLGMRLAAIDEEIEGLVTGTVTEESQARLATLQAEKEKLEGISGTRDRRTRIPALMEHFGVDPNTADYYKRHPEIFSSDYFDITVQDMFNTEEETADDTEVVFQSSRPEVTTEAPSIEEPTVEDTLPEVPVEEGEFDFKGTTIKMSEGVPVSASIGENTTESQFDLAVIADSVNIPVDKRVQAWLKALTEEDLIDLTFMSEGLLRQYFEYHQVDQDEEVIQGLLDEVSRLKEEANVPTGQ